MPAPIPVYDEAGALFAPTCAEAARLLGLRDANKLLAHTALYRDGWRLTSRPRYAGRRGGARFDHIEATCATPGCHRRAASANDPTLCGRCYQNARKRRTRRNAKNAPQR